MNMVTLFGKLREYELELGRLKKEEDGEKKHIIALKFVAKTVAKTSSGRDESGDEQVVENSHSEALNLMVNKFSKILKYKNKTNHDFVGNKRSYRK